MTQRATTSKDLVQKEAGKASPGRVGLEQTRRRALSTPPRQTADRCATPSTARTTRAGAIAGEFMCASFASHQSTTGILAHNRRAKTQVVRRARAKRPHTDTWRIQVSPGRFGMRVTSTPHSACFIPFCRRRAQSRCSTLPGGVGKTGQRLSERLAAGYPS